MPLCYYTLAKGAYVTTEENVCLYLNPKVVEELRVKTSTFLKHSFPA